MLTQKEVEEIMKRKDQLSQQKYQDIETLTPISPEVISRQATINIGTIGHVAHGKSTVVKAISGVNTIKHTDEQVRSITIKLGYANAKIYKCKDCPSPQCYQSHSSDTTDNMPCALCKKTMKLVRHISFVDCPGHDILMATMLTGAAVMDAALLLISAEIDCPQPQTLEHLVAVEIMNLNRIIILQNKVDLIYYKDNKAEVNYQQIKNFIKGTNAEKSPIIPISAQFKYNIDFVLQYLVDFIPIPKRDIKSSPVMIVIRSFDVNKPGSGIESLKGGIAGGSILNGVLKVGDDIEVRPGVVETDPETGKIHVSPIQTKITSLFAEKNELLYAIPGGLIGVGTLMDPCLTIADMLVGNIIGYPGKLPDVYDELEIDYHLLRRLVGVKQDMGNDKVQKLQKKDILLVNVGSTSTPGRIISAVAKHSLVKIAMFTPVCTDIGEKVALSRKIGKNWRLIGWGNIKTGNVIYSDKNDNQDQFKYFNQY